MLRAALIAAIVLTGCGGAASEPDTTRTPRPALRTTPEPVSETVGVLYKLTGSATGADLTYTDGSGNIQQQTGKAVPLRRTSGQDGIGFRASAGDFVQFSAQNTGSSGDLTCVIEAVQVVDGEARFVEVNTGHASGGYAIVSCSAVLP